MRGGPKGRTDMEPRFRIARLDAPGLEKLKVLEEEYGGCVVAVEAQYPLARLSDDQIKRVQALEREAGVILLAYQRN